MRTRQLQKLAEFMAHVAVEATHENREEALVMLQLSRDFLLVELARKRRTPCHIPQRTQKEETSSAKAD